jgi:hypothetical protein
MNRIVAYARHQPRPIVGYRIAKHQSAGMKAILAALFSTASVKTQTALRRPNVSGADIGSRWRRA